MKKQFVTYEIALKLKDLGFDEECFGKYYTLDGKTWQIATNEYFDLLDETYNIGRNFWINAPLWQQVIDWFREKYKYLVVTDVANEEEYYASVRKFDDCGTIISLIPYKIYSTYQEAREQAILKTIELCKKEK